MCSGNDLKVKINLVNMRIACFIFIQLALIQLCLCVVSRDFENIPQEAEELDNHRSPVILSKLFDLKVFFFFRISFTLGNGEHCIHSNHYTNGNKIIQMEKFAVY